MKIEQVTIKPCAMCSLVKQLAKLTRFEWLVYAQHLRRKHALKPYYVER